MPISNEPVNPAAWDRHPKDEIGLTKREYFAAQALQAIVAQCYAGDTYINPADAADTAVSMADALIRRLS